MAKQILQENPALVFHADLRSAGWKHLLKNMKRTNLHVPRGDGFSHLQRQMLADIASDQRDDGLITTLGALGLFDLSEFAAESSAWTALPVALLNDFIGASMVGTVLRLSRGELKLQQLVPPLKARLSDRATAMVVIRKDVMIGDVVAATKVYGYESGKLEECSARVRTHGIPATRWFSMRTASQEKPLGNRALSDCPRTGSGVLLDTSPQAKR